MMSILASVGHSATGDSLENVPTILPPLFKVVVRGGCKERNFRGSLTGLAAALKTARPKKTPHPARYRELGG